MVYFSERLRYLRKSLNMSQLTLSQRILVTKAAVSAYETGLNYPSYDVLVRIANLFHVTTDYLLGRDKGVVVDLSRLTQEQSAAILQVVGEFQKFNE